VTRPEGYGIRITPLAAQQLKEEMSWSRRRWGRQHQLSYRRALLRRLEQIAASPYGYRERPELGSGVRLVHHAGLYIVFLINEEQGWIEVIAFPNVHRELEHGVADSLEAWRRAKKE